MTDRTASIVSGLLTFVIVIVIAVVSVFGQLVVLNGVSEGQAFNALVISVVCQSVGLLVAVIIARWLSKLLITKFNLNRFLAILITVIVATGFGGLNAFLSVILSIPLAGIK